MRAGASHNSKWGEGASIATLLAIFALLIQALLPTAALAAQNGAAQNAGGGETIVICTQMGVQVITPDQKPAPHKGFAGLPCQNCLAAAHAVTLTSGVAVAPVAYVVAHVRHTRVERTAPQLARAPPRPPGQGPPASNA